MASLTKEIVLDARPDEVWAALRDFGAVHERLVPGFVVDCRLESDDVRTVTFFNGAVARERLVTVDDGARRLVYSVVESRLEATHDSTAAQVIPLGEHRTRFVWIKDVLPDELAPVLSGMMDRGVAALAATWSGLPAS